MEFLLGALGAIVVIALFALGVLVGWKAHKRFARPKAEKVSDEDMKLMKAQQEAFRQMQNYTAEMAYGIGSDAV